MQQIFWGYNIMKNSSISYFIIGMLSINSCIEIKTNLMSMALDMGLPMATQMASSAANQFISEEQQAIFADLQSELTSTTNALKAWSEQQKELVQKQTDATGQFFSSQMETIQNAQASAQQQAQAESDYLFQNLSLQQPAKSFVSLNSASSFDQLFTSGIMATPTHPFTWYNILGIGDWVYDPISNSFWQNQAIPFPAADPDPKKQATAIDLLSTNNIFVEYYPSQKPYTISGSLTLYKATYPFFTGIMFNKTRWISGNQEGEHQCRLLGIYATSATTAGIYFAEQYKLSDQDLQKNPVMVPVQIPLAQIMNGSIKQLAPISAQSMNALSSGPVTFQFSISTSPTEVAFKIWNSTETEPAQATLLKNLDPDFYLYHTLGFISPGAASEWKLIAPTDLVFSAQALSNFKNKVFPPKP